MRFVLVGSGGAARLAALAILVLGTAVLLLWGTGRVVDRSRAQALDSRLTADLQIARATLEAQETRADGRAAALARSTTVQQALVDRDAPTLRQLARAHRSVLFQTASGIVAGSLPAFGVRQAVKVELAGRVVGDVVVSVPLDRQFLSLVRSRQPAGAGDLLVVIHQGLVIAGPLPAGTALSAGARRLAPGPKLYRVLTWPVATDDRGVAMAALVRDDSPLVDAWRAPVAGLAIGSVVLLVVIWLLRLDEGILRRAAGAKASTATAAVDVSPPEDFDWLLRKVLAAAIEATGAAGGRIEEGGDMTSLVGELAAGLLRVPIAIAGADNRSVILYPPPEGFAPAAADVAFWVGVQATAAIRNARAHGIAHADPATEGTQAAPS
jgi:hypothetical protein